MLIIIIILFLLLSEQIIFIIVINIIFYYIMHNNIDSKQKGYLPCEKIRRKRKAMSGDEFIGCTMEQDENAGKELLRAKGNTLLMYKKSRKLEGVFDETETMMSEDEVRSIINYNAL